MVTQRTYSISQGDYASLNYFLKSIRLVKYFKIFRDHEITLEQLKKINLEKMKAMGIPLGARKKIKERLQKYTIPSTKTNTTTTPSQTSTLWNEIEQQDEPRKHLQQHYQHEPTSSSYQLQSQSQSQSQLQSQLQSHQLHQTHQSQWYDIMNDTKKQHYNPIHSHDHPSPPHLSPLTTKAHHHLNHHDDDPYDPQEQGGGYWNEMNMDMRYVHGQDMGQFAQLVTKTWPLYKILTFDPRLAARNAEYKGKEWMKVVEKKKKNLTSLSKKEDRYVDCTSTPLQEITSWTCHAPSFNDSFPFFLGDQGNVFQTPPDILHLLSTQNHPTTTTTSSTNNPTTLATTTTKEHPFGEHQPSYGRQTTSPKLKKTISHHGTPTNLHPMENNYSFYRKFAVFGCDYSIATFEQIVTFQRLVGTRRYECLDPTSDTGSTSSSSDSVSSRIEMGRRVSKRRLSHLSRSSHSKRIKSLKHEKSPTRGRKKRKKKCFRSGRWTTEEENYVRYLMTEFESGLLPLTNGTMLRMFLAAVLNCERMRISKKFAGRGPKKHVTDSMGKHVFQRDQEKVDQLTKEDIARKQKELTDLEYKFLRKVQDTELAVLYASEDERNTIAQAAPRPMYMGWHTYNPQRNPLISYFGENRSERGGRKPKEKLNLLLHGEGEGARNGRSGGISHIVPMSSPSEGSNLSNDLLEMSSYSGIRSHHDEELPSSITIHPNHNGIFNFAEEVDFEGSTQSFHMLGKSENLIVEEVDPMENSHLVDLSPATVPYYLDHLIATQGQHLKGTENMDDILPVNWQNDF